MNCVERYIEEEVSYQRIKTAKYLERMDSEDLSDEEVEELVNGITEAHFELARIQILANIIDIGKLTPYLVDSEEEFRRLAQLRYEELLATKESV